jgi:hypothetical protein
MCFRLGVGVTLVYDFASRSSLEPFATTNHSETYVNTLELKLRPCQHETASETNKALANAEWETLVGQARAPKAILINSHSDLAMLCGFAFSICVFVFAEWRFPNSAAYKTWARSSILRLNRQGAIWSRKVRGLTRGGSPKRETHRIFEKAHFAKTRRERIESWKTAERADNYDRQKLSTSSA